MIFFEYYLLTTFIKVYPYEYFQSVETIRNCTTFPAYQHFATSLSRDVDKTVYDINKTEFERRMLLPVGHDDKWHSFEDYLRYYNGKKIIKNNHNYHKFHDYMIVNYNFNI